MHRIFIPGIILIEIVYLVEKGRITESAFSSILKLLNTSNGSYRVAPLDETTAKALFQIPRESVPDMPDRIIAATAKSLKLPLLTCDGKITSAKVVTTIW